MGFFDFFKGKEKPEAVPVQTLSGSYPYYSQHNQLESIWDADITWQCIDRIADEIAKLMPCHVLQTVGNVEYVNDNVQTVLRNFNPQLTTFDALQKIVYTLFTRSNAFIYPVFSTYFEGGSRKKSLTALYPVIPMNAELVTDNGTDYIRLLFGNGYKPTIPYDSIIHIRRNFREDDFMGKINEAPLLKNMQLNHNLLQSLEKNVNAGLKVNGVVQYGSVMSKNLLQDEVKAFENQLKKSETGILGLDQQSSYREIKRDPKLIDEPTLKFIQSLVCNHFNVPASILNGTATKEEYDYWFQSCIMPLLESFSQAFTKVLFTSRERSLGHAIQFYNYDRLKFMTSAELNDAVKMLTEAGAITINQMLTTYGLPPIGEEGNKRVQSLNFIDTNIANDYQLETNKKNKGGNSNEE